MRVRRRHAWGAVLIALFILPVLRPGGVETVERPTGEAFGWLSEVVPSGRAPGATQDDHASERRVRELEEQYRLLFDRHLRKDQRIRLLGELKQALDRSKLDRVPRAVLSEVLRAHDPVPRRRSILLDRGAADGVRLGLPVVMGGVFLGRVRVVRTHSCLVQLVTDPRSRIEVFVRTSKGQMLRGYAHRAGSKDGQDMLEIEFVRLRGDVGVIRPGAPVFTSNFDERVPAHLLVGTVDEVHDPDRDRMPTITVRPSLDLDRSTEVVVLVPTVSAPR